MLPLKEENQSLLSRAAKKVGSRKLFTRLDSEQRAVLFYLWPAVARPEQVSPPGDWAFWLYLAGRGAGKTRSGAEWIRSRVKEGYRKIAFVAPTAADGRDVMIEGESGILSVCAPWDKDNKGRVCGVPLYEPSKRRITWKNGAKALVYSSEKPARLRGPQFDTAWADEIASWQSAIETWDNLLFGLRLGNDPRGVITTTPRPIKIIKDLLKDDTVIRTAGSTYDNRANLAKAFYNRIVSKYEGTRLGRQEIYAELLEDNPDALWERETIDASRVSTEDFDVEILYRIVVGVDPAVTAGEESADTGIVVAGADDRGHFYILRDDTCHKKPKGWATKAIFAFNVLDADLVVGEVNNGGDLVETVIHSIDENVAFKAVRASRGKYVRAEPISALYEQGRVHHVGIFPELEDQMCQWSQSLNEPSPDRLDALVWALTELSKEGTGTGLRML